MKIIGRTEHGVICEATDDELARIGGIRCSHEADPALVNQHSIDRVFRVGVKVEVSAMWDWMTETRAAFKNCTEAAAMLRATSVILDRIPPDALTDKSGT